MCEYKKLRQVIDTCPLIYSQGSFKQAASDYSHYLCTPVRFARHYTVNKSGRCVLVEDVAENNLLPEYVGSSLTYTTLIRQLDVLPELAKKIEESLVTRLNLVKQPLSDYLFRLHHVEREIAKNYIPDEDNRLGNDCSVVAAICNLFIHHMENFSIDKIREKVISDEDNQSCIFPELNCGLYLGGSDSLTFVLHGGEFTYHHSGKQRYITFRSTTPMYGVAIIEWLPTFAEELYLMMYYIVNLLIEEE